MFNKTSSPLFREFGLTIYDDINFSESKLLSFNNKSIHILMLVSMDNVYLKVDKGLVMIVLSNDKITTKSFIINKTIKLYKDTYFNLISISDEAQVSITYNIDDIKTLNLEKPYIYSSISSSLSINEICTKFYQEKGYNYIFLGESHSYWELTYVDKGLLYSTINGTDYELKQGDIIFYAPNQLHTQYTLNNTCSYLTINFKMDFKQYEMLCDTVFTLERDSHFIISKLINELAYKDIYYNDLSLCYLKELIISIIRLSTSSSKILPTTTMQQSYENELLDEILKYIDNNLYERLSIDTLCSHFGMSTSMIHSLFKKI